MRIFAKWRTPTPFEEFQLFYQQFWLCCNIFGDFDKVHLELSIPIFLVFKCYLGWQQWQCKGMQRFICKSCSCLRLTNLQKVAKAESFNNLADLQFIMCLFLKHTRPHPAFTFTLRLFKICFYSTEIWLSHNWTVFQRIISAQHADF